MKGAFVSPAALINLLQQGLQQAEIMSTGDDGTETRPTQSISLDDAPDIDAYRQNAQNAQYQVKAGPSSGEVVVDEPDSTTPSAPKRVKLTLTTTCTAAAVATTSGAGPSSLDQSNQPASTTTILSGHKFDVLLCAWNPRNNLIVTGSADSTARIWDMSDNSPTPSFQVLKHANTRSGDEVPVNKESDGDLLATGNYDGYIRLWTTDGCLASTLPLHKGPVFSVRWNKLGNYLLSAGVDKTAIIWDASTGKCKEQFSFHSGPILEAAWQSNTTFATCSTDNEIHVCKLNVDSPLITFKGHTNEVNAIRWDPQGRLLASCSDDMTLKIWSMDQDTCVHDLREHDRVTYDLSWSPTGPGTAYPNMNSILASASFDNTVKLWDAERGVCIINFTKHTKYVYSVAFSPDGKYLASGAFDKCVHIWCAQTGEVVHSYRSRGGIFDLSWDPSGTKVGAGAAHGCAFVLDLRYLKDM